MRDFKWFRQSAIYTLTSFRSWLLPANFIPAVRQPAAIIGYPRKKRIYTAAVSAQIAEYFSTAAKNSHSQTRHRSDGFGSDCRRPCDA
jgi:hypothetical protein